MYYNLIPHNINHQHLRNDVDTMSTVALHILTINWIYYIKVLKTSTRNFLLHYKIIQTNTTVPRYQPLFTNAMKNQ